MHYAALTGGAFLEKGAVAVVGHLSKMALTDAATRAMLIDDLKKGKPLAEGALLLNELSAFGGSTSVCLCMYVCVCVCVCYVVAE